MNSPQLEDFATYYLISPWNDQLLPDLLCFALLGTLWGTGYLIVARVLGKPKAPCLVGFLLAVVLLGGSVVRVAQIARARDSLGQGSVVAGLVFVKHQQPLNGHGGDDVISIAGVDFALNWFSYSLGYNRTLAHGGILRDGVYVKVFHIGGRILRIDALQ
ncbi:MAG: hypothetical protein KDB14_29995 [Planctomycetales bacterium]|nr:hypothetical protein [Planctomycetales bacterium]